MRDEYAVAEGEAILFATDGFRPERVTETAALSGGKRLLICSQDREALRTRLEEAEKAIAAKDTFLSSMSHDIRTPMNAIVGLTLLARMHLDETARVSDALSKIETASSHLLSLINDVLDMSSINSGKLQITLEAFALNDLIHETMTILRPQAEKKHHTLRLETESITAETLLGDVLRLRQIYVNILSNAIKYTPEGGQITVRFSEAARGDQTELSFACEDNGIGMSAEFLQRVFEPFERVQSSTVSRVEGTGLGMSIVKKLVDAMAGEITVRSAPGEGTLVTVRVPLASRPEELRPDALRGRRALILEADEALRRAYADGLSDTGMAFELTASAQEALSALADADIHRQPFDLILIGQACEGSEDKLDIAAYLHRSAPDLPMLLVSEDNWEQLRYRAEHSCISAFVPLPLFRRTLIRALADALEGEPGREAASGYPDLSGRRILLVEDNMINREIAREILGETGAQIDIAEDGRQAVSMFSAEPAGAYCVILMDVQMPVMDGYEATRAIRALPRADARTVPIYAMTANTFAEDIARAKEAGMDGHIAKPIDVNTLMQVLRELPG